MPLIDVQDPEDTRLDAYRQVRDKDLRGRRGAFMAEGRVVLEALIEGGRFPLRSVLVSDRRLPNLTDLLDRVPETVPIFVTPHDDMIATVGFNIHRGLLAVGERLPEPTPEAVLEALPEGPATILVLEGLTNADNVGACFRNAAALGAEAILLDPKCCDPLYRKAIRVSAGHSLTLPFGRAASMPAMLDTLTAAGFSTAAMCLRDDAIPLIGCTRPTERLAIALGTEGHGLSQRTIDRAELAVRIPMSRGVDSLNVATAGAVALFALRRP